MDKEDSDSGMSHSFNRPIAPFSLAAVLLLGALVPLNLYSSGYSVEDTMLHPAPYSSLRGVQNAPYSEYVHINEFMFMPHQRYNNTGIYGEFDEWIEIYYDINAPGPLKMDNWTVIYNNKSIAEVELYALGSDYGLNLPPVEMKPGDYLYINFSDPPSYYDFSDFMLAASAAMNDIYDTDGNGIHVAYYKAIMWLAGLDSPPDLLCDNGGYIALYNATGEENLTTEHLIDFVAWDSDGVLNSSQSAWDDTAVAAGKWRNGAFIGTESVSYGESIGLMPNGSDKEPVSRWYVFSSPTYGVRPELANDPTAKINASNTGGTVLNLPPEPAWVDTWNGWYSGSIALNASVNDPDWVDSEPSVTYEYSTDNITWHTITSIGEAPYAYSWDTTSIIPGFDPDVWVRAIATDDMGSEGIVVSHFIGIDNIPPTVTMPTASNITEDSVDGLMVSVSASDEGSGISGVYISYERGGYDQDYIGPYPMEAVNENTWTYTVPPPDGGWGVIGGGYVRYIISVSDAAGNTNTTGEMSEWVDSGNIPPVISWLSEWSDEVWYGGDVWLNVSAYDIDGSVASVSMEYSNDSSGGSDGTWQPCLGEWHNASGRYSLLWLTPPHEGAIWVRAVCSDDSGLESLYIKARIMLDTIPPAVDASLPDGWYSRPINTTLNALDGGSGVAGVYYSINGGGFVPYGGGNISINHSGENTLEFYAVDRAGNIGPTYSASYGIDTEAPVLVSVAWDDINAASAGPLNVTAVLEDNVSGIANATLSYAISELNCTGSVEGHNTNGEWLFTVHPSIGWSGCGGKTLNFNISFSDLAGNRAVSPGYSEVIETINQPPVIGLRTPEQDTVMATAGEAALFSIDASDPDGDEVAVEWLVDGNRTGEGSQFTFNPSDAGVYIVSAEASDGSGGVARTTWTVIVVPVSSGGAPPEVHIITPDRDAITVKQEESVNFTYTVSSTSQYVSLEWTVDGAVVSTLTVPEEDYGITLVEAIPFNDAGDHTVILRATAGGYFTVRYWNIHVTAINTPPGMWVISPVGANITMGESDIHMKVVPYDRENSTLYVTISMDGETIYSAQINTSLYPAFEYDINSSLLGPGNHVLALTVSDGEYNTSRSWNITVAAGNHPPLLLDPAYTPGDVSVGEYVTFTVTYVDPDGDAPAGVFLVLNGIQYPMEKLASEDTVYSDGVVYYTRVKITEPVDLLYFKCGDGKSVTTTTPMSGPTITAEKEAGQQPQSLIDEVTLPIVIILLLILAFIGISQIRDENGSEKARNQTCESCIWYDTESGMCSRFNSHLKNLTICDYYKEEDEDDSIE